MFLGTGKLDIRLCRADGTEVEVIAPPRPTERLAEDWEDQFFTSLPPDVDGNEDTPYLGSRFRAHYRWIGTAHNQTAMADLRKVQNWVGNDGRYVRIWLHEENTTLVVRCKVKARPIAPLGGKLSGDVIEIEFVGLDMTDRKPNPLYDQVGKVARRGSVNTTARTFGL